MNALPIRNRRLAWKLALAALLMSGFGYATVPLYERACRAIGLNGTTSHIDYSEALAYKPDTSRLVTVEFVTNTQGDLPWEFEPLVPNLRVYPGELVTARFRARNVGGAAMTAQAVPSVAPSLAARHFYNVGGLCDSGQALAPGEAKDLPLTFVVDPALPPGIGTLTLSLAFFEAPRAATRDAAPVTLVLGSPL